MDLQMLNDRLNDAVNRWVHGITEYFSSLNQNEQYGWIAFAVGFILFVVGIVLW